MDKIELEKTIERVMEKRRLGCYISDKELLTALLYDISIFVSADKAAEKLLEKYGSLSEVCTVPYDVLKNIEGVGTRGAQLICTLDASIPNILEGRSTIKRRKLFKLEEFDEYMRKYFIKPTVEMLYMVMLDYKFRLIDVKLIAKGSDCSLDFDYKYILDLVIKHKAAHILLAHNHLITQVPSKKDIEHTLRLRDLLAVIGVELGDHYICHENRFYSMRDYGIFDKEDKKKDKDSDKQ